MNTFKLYSPRSGVLLGIITVPPNWAREMNGDNSFKRRKYVRWALMPKLPFAMPIDCDALPAAVPHTYTEVVIVRSHEHRGGWELVEGTLEDLEKIHGVFFAPSAAYLRSLID